MNDIKVAKLVSAEVIVGKEVDGVLENCLLLQAMPVEGNQIRMGISPYLAPYSREEAAIDMSFCICIHDADAELIAQYQQITSGIVQATPGDLSAMTTGMGGPVPGPGGALNLVK